MDASSTKRVLTCMMAVTAADSAPGVRNAHTVSTPGSMGTSLDAGFPAWLGAGDVVWCGVGAVGVLGYCSSTV